jgi:3-hydroxybutyryl-CoA dehydratase
VNEYALGDLVPGLRESFRRTVTAEMMDAFETLSGDVNPLHRDASFAIERGYPGRVVYGMLTASLYSALAGVYLPGKYCLLRSVDAKFLKPVFIGDELTVVGEVAEIHPDLGVALVKATITNQWGEKVSRAVLQCGFLLEDV